MDGFSPRSSGSPISPVQRPECQAAALLVMVAIVGWLGLLDWQMARHRQSPEPMAISELPSPPRTHDHEDGRYHSLRPVWPDEAGRSPPIAEIDPVPNRDPAASCDGECEPRLSPIILDINTATSRDFRLLPRIGPKLADRIVRHRDSIGEFASVDAMSDVPGIGGKTLELIRPHCDLDRSPESADPNRERDIPPSVRPFQTTVTEAKALTARAQRKAVRP